MGAHENLNFKCFIHTHRYIYPFMCAQSSVWSFVTPRTVAHQTPLSPGDIFRQEYWSGLLFSPPEDLLNPGITPMSLASPALAGEFFTTEPPGKPISIYIIHKNIWFAYICICVYIFEGRQILGQLADDFITDYWHKILEQIFLALITICFTQRSNEITMLQIKIVCASSNRENDFSGALWTESC